jgi:hypothetical protein
MSIKARTIDDLGIEASNQYAKNQKELDRRLIEESHLFPSISEIGGIFPYAPPEYEDRFAVKRYAVWAGFKPPKNYPAVASRLFTYQFIPSLGSAEKQQALIDTFSALGETVPKDPVQQYEYKKILSLLQLLAKLGKTFDLIIARCNQYQRG